MTEKERNERWEQLGERVMRIFDQYYLEGYIFESYQVDADEYVELLPGWGPQARRGPNRTITIRLTDPNWKRPI